MSRPHKHVTLPAPDLSVSGLPRTPVHRTLPPVVSFQDSESPSERVRVDLALAERARHQLGHVTYLHHNGSRWPDFMVTRSTP